MGHDAVYSYDLIRAELLKRGYTCNQLRLNGSFSIFTSPRGGSWLTWNGRLLYPFVSHIAKLISINKWRAQLLADSEGVNPPRTLVWPDQAEALPAFLAENHPVIVKPADSFGSQGLTRGVQDNDALQQAIRQAKELSGRVLVQRQFTGQEVRLTISRGKLVSAIVRKTPQVMGDGHHTIAELVELENEQRRALHTPYITYPELTADVIPARFLTDTRVPAAGEIVEFSKRVSIREGGSPYDITEDIHHSYAEAALNLANVLNPDFLVVDFMIQDFRRPLTAENYIFLEFTTSPSLILYASLRNRLQTEVIGLIADLIDEYCSRQRQYLSE